MTMFLLAAAASVCLSTAPAPTAGLVWVCVDGGWQPRQPVAQAPLPTPPPPTANAAVAWRTGHVYQHMETGRLVYVTGLVQLRSQHTALVFECVNAVDICSYVGELKPSPANVSTSGWMDVTP